MKNGKVLAVKAVLAKHGITVDTDVALEVIMAVDQRSGAEYEVGDFVMLYEGMGEISFATVEKVEGQGHIEVRGWDEKDEVDDDWVSERSRSISQLSSKEEARDYYLVRSGQKKPSK